MLKNDVIHYKSCGSCFNKIVKSTQFYCKKCQVKPCNINMSNSIVYKMKFNKSSKVLTNIKNVTQKYLGN
jgi:hypothetical protein